MSANHLTDGKTYLEIAIDAQHGGFPSRLLDVTYNCIVALYFAIMKGHPTPCYQMDAREAALYFAITPYYTESETSHDNEDGIVYIFFLEDIYCPTGNNINQAYNACIDHNSDWFSDQELFQKNHKLIDQSRRIPVLSRSKVLSSCSRRTFELIPPLPL